MSRPAVSSGVSGFPIAPGDLARALQPTNHKKREHLERDEPPKRNARAAGKHGVNETF